jgi:hypothetical protein
MKTEVKERPLLMKGPLVCATLADLKRETRRLIKPDWSRCLDLDDEADRAQAIANCPWGKVGERLWIRETWADVNSDDGPAIAYRADGSVSPWRDWCEEPGPDYGAGPSMNYERYPGEYTMWVTDLLRGEPGHTWKPSIHMPRWACRIVLEITSVRIERLQDITFDGIREEGIGCPEHDHEHQATGTEFLGIRKLRYTITNGWQCSECPALRAEFARLWDSTTSAAAFKWVSNPWVFVIGYKRVE